jgi:lipoprotein LprG
MILRRALTGILLVLLVAVSGCSGSSGTPTAASTTAPPPTASEILAASATAMAEVTSAAFSLTVDGQLPSVTVQSAKGVLNADGDAQGTAAIVQFGQLIEVEFVLAGGQLYIKGVTGGFTQVPASLAGSVYDPSAILDPTRGVAKVISSVQSPTIAGSEGDSWLISGSVPADVAAGLVPGITDDVTGLFTISKGSSELTSADLTLDGADGKPATVKVELSAFNEPVSISPPN